MVEATMTRGELQSWIDGAVTKSLETLKSEYESKMSQDDQADTTPAALPSIIDIHGLIDGRPVKADLIDGRYHANQASMKAPGIAGILESGDNFRIPFLDLKLGPVVSAGVGIFGGTVVFNVVDSLVAPKDAQGKNSLMNLGAQTLAAGALATWGPKYVGKTAAYFMSGTIAVGLLMRWTPFQEWVVKVTELVSQPFASLKGAVGLHQMGAGVRPMQHALASGPAHAQYDMNSSGISLANQ